MLFDHIGRRRTTVGRMIARRSKDWLQTNVKTNVHILTAEARNQMDCRPMIDQAITETMN